MWGGARVCVRAWACVCVRACVRLSVRVCPDVCVGGWVRGGCAVCEWCGCCHVVCRYCVTLCVPVRGRLWEPVVAAHGSRWSRRVWRCWSTAMTSGDSKCGLWRSARLCRRASAPIRKVRWRRLCDAGGGCACVRVRARSRACGWWWCVRMWRGGGVIARGAVAP